MLLPPISKPVFYLPAKLYELAIRARIALYKQGIIKTYNLNAPVISIGNLTIGGTGKTPCVAFLARMLLGSGCEVAILSRGYKRSSEGRVEVSDGRDILCGPRESGDEPWLLAMSCPGVRVVVDRDRVAAGRWLEQRARVSAFLLDDGFQHLRLARNLNLVLIDATEDLAKARMIPFGRLREPLAALQRADAMIITRSDRPFDRKRLETVIERHAKKKIPFFYSHHRMASLLALEGEGSARPSTFNGKKVAAVSGIARPEQFNEDLSKFGMKIVLRRDFDDHHRYTPEEFLEIVESAGKAGAEAIVVTEKDAANLPGGFAARSALPLYAARIEFVCEDEPALKEVVLKTVKHYAVRR